MHRGLLAALLSIALLIALALPAVASAGTLDQQQTDGSAGSYGLLSSQSLAQTFTAGISGNLDEVDLFLINGGGVGVYVEIRDASSSGPGDRILASHIVPDSAIPASGPFVPVKLDSPAPVAAGNQYAIVAYASNASGFRWGRGPFGDSYPGGAGFGVATSPPTGPWAPTGTDLAFKTYVVPTPASTGQRAAALKKCKKKHSKTARRKCRKKAKLLPV